MDALALLQAESQCRHLIIAAAEAVDGQQYEAFVDCFTEDAVLQRPGGVPLAGRAAILASYALKSPDRLTQHLLCNHRVVVDPSGWASRLAKCCFTSATDAVSLRLRADWLTSSTMWVSYGTG